MYYYPARFRLLLSCYVYIFFFYSSNIQYNSFSNFYEVHRSVITDAVLRRIFVHLFLFLMNPHHLILLLFSPEFNIFSEVFLLSSELCYTKSTSLRCMFQIKCQIQSWNFLKFDTFSQKIMLIKNLITDIDSFLSIIVSNDICRFHYSVTSFFWCWYYFIHMAAFSWQIYLPSWFSTS